MKNIKMHDFNNCKPSYLTYGGNAGTKKGIIYDDNYYLLKFPKNTNDMRKMEIAYTIAPICEYIGSQVYKLLGIPVHETLLGIYKGKVVVACKDIEFERKKPIGRFSVFANIINDHTEAMFDRYINNSNANLQYCLDVINTNELVLEVGRDVVLQRFFEMFVVDTLLNNNDRNNGNWGLLLSEESSRIAPVIDNGNSFNNKFSDLQMLARMEKLEEVQCKNIQSFYEDAEGKNIKPYVYVTNYEERFLDLALTTIVPKIDMNSIENMLADIPEEFGDLPVCSSVMKKFVLESMRVRYEKILLPAYERAKGR